MVHFANEPIVPQQRPADDAVEAALPSPAIVGPGDNDAAALERIASPA